MVTRRPSMLVSAHAPFGNVSVVMIASAAASQPDSPPPAAIAGTAFTISGNGSGSPMTPVDAT